MCKNLIMKIFFFQSFTAHFLISCLTISNTHICSAYIPCVQKCQVWIHVLLPRDTLSTELGSGVCLPMTWLCWAHSNHTYTNGTYLKIFKGVDQNIIWQYASTASTQYQEESSQAMSQPRLSSKTSKYSDISCSQHTTRHALQEDIKEVIDTHRVGCSSSVTEDHDDNDGITV